MTFNMKIEKATIINSQTVSAEDMGDWKASLNGPIKIKDPQSMANFTSVTVYKVVTVEVSNQYTCGHIEEIPHLLWEE